MGYGRTGFSLDMLRTRRQDQNSSAEQIQKGSLMLRKLLVVTAATAALGFTVPATAAAAPPDGPWVIPGTPCATEPGSLGCFVEKYILPLLSTGSAGSGSSDTGLVG